MVCVGEGVFFCALIIKYVMAMDKILLHCI